MSNQYRFEIQSEGITLSVGKWLRGAVFVSIKIGKHKPREATSLLRIRLSMGAKQADAFFVALATAVGYDAPHRDQEDLERRCPSHAGYIRVGRRGKNVEIAIRGRSSETYGLSSTGKFKMTIAQARNLCDQIAPMLGWDLHVVA